MTITSTSLTRVQAIIAESLGLPDGGAALGPETRLFGALPELDSLAVLDLLSGLEEEFGIRIDDDEFGSQIFDSVGSLVEFVDGKLVDVSG
jgi:acyl carrier protein